ncbi:MAG TPA: hypothetical protein VKU00_15820 [Chthonomonadaceae bacterium]|nr:hypothetical protein [Chthonomonadaceae bacterium]
MPTTTYIIHCNEEPFSIVLDSIGQGSKTVTLNIPNIVFCIDSTLTNTGGMAPRVTANANLMTQMLNGSSAGSQGASGSRGYWAWGGSAPVPETVITCILSVDFIDIYGPASRWDTDTFTITCYDCGDGPGGTIEIFGGGGGTGGTGSSYGCMKDINTTPNTYFPFAPQFGDNQLLPLEEWRRIPNAPEL